ncbi:LysR family transcriptional regulator [Oxalobacter vibrioformis]|uniref:LysR family transcriptional regulator n=1 Tax=Oxalobacter vibrioformis TaxID=933080 RepID=A0A9E9P358_9BURK|nr:LysR family transcriptional regulator [Oxalobacter vibrioformis]NLC23156.1 LysR family transcriptional regulator [Oxalobacter sp.]WAW10649.1 LysR family transcriptional regulator [Oxalobacter vibrioformis]
MDLKQLRYFCAIAEEGNISRAAERLHISQPPLSLQLKLLEEELGVKLVERNTRHLRLTQIGHTFYHRATQILDLIGTTAEEIRNMEHGIHGVLSLGGLPAMGGLYIPDRIKIFSEKYPHVRFNWRGGNTYRILELLDAHVIEFGIVRLPIPAGAYESIPLLTEAWVAVAHAQDEKWMDQDVITLKELSEAPLILMHRQDGARSHDMVLDAMRQADLAPNIFCESDQVSALLSLVDRQLGIAILPESALSIRPPEDFHRMAIADCNLQSSSAIIWRSGKRLSAAARLFLELF